MSKVGFDKYGKCPNCNTDWNIGDINEVLGRLDIFSHKTEYEVRKVAANYGWTEFNKGNFSGLEVINVDDSTIGKCSNMRCGHFFNLETGDEFSRLTDAVNNENKIERVEA